MYLVCVLKCFFLRLFVRLIPSAGFNLVFEPETFKQKVTIPDPNHDQCHASPFFSSPNSRSLSPYQSASFIPSNEKKKTTDIRNVMQIVQKLSMKLCIFHPAKQFQNDKILEKVKKKQHKMRRWWFWPSKKKKRWMEESVRCIWWDQGKKEKRR